MPRRLQASSRARPRSSRSLSCATANALFGLADNQQRRYKCPLSFQRGCEPAEAPLHEPDVSSGQDPLLASDHLDHRDVVGMLGVKAVVRA